MTLRGACPGVSWAAPSKPATDSATQPKVCCWTNAETGSSVEFSKNEFPRPSCSALKAWSCGVSACRSVRARLGCPSRSPPRSPAEPAPLRGSTRNPGWPGFRRAAVSCVPNLAKGSSRGGRGHPTVPHGVGLHALEDQRLLGLAERVRRKANNREFQGDCSGSLSRVRSAQVARARPPDRPLVFAQLRLGSPWPLGARERSSLDGRALGCRHRHLVRKLESEMGLARPHPQARLQALGCRRLRPERSASP